MTITRKVTREFPQLIGKTIAKAELIGSEEFDDIDGFGLTFTDGTGTFVSGSFSCYTGESQDEYPVIVSVNYYDFTEEQL